MPHYAKHELQYRLLSALHMYWPDQGLTDSHSLL